MILIMKIVKLPIANVKILCLKSLNAYMCDNLWFTSLQQDNMYIELCKVFK